MARFRRSGKNWEGREWYTSKGLNSLMDEIEAAFPDPVGIDGTVASKQHDANNPSSDHRPRPFSGTGVVRAVDAGEKVENHGIVLAEALRENRDPRIKYVIHEGRLFSSYNHSAGAAWTWRPYSGYNAHLSHVHVSVNSKADSDGSAWNLGLEEQEESMKELVTFIQEALKDAGIDPGPIDGLLGPKTKAALVKGLSGGTPHWSRASIRKIIADALNNG